VSKSVTLPQPTQSIKGSRLHMRHRPQSSLMMSSTTWPQSSKRAFNQTDNCFPYIPGLISLSSPVSC
jgi:hypothetical protein